jgi:hypothetical protein
MLLYINIMASTRNKNCINNFNLEQRNMDNSRMYNFYAHSQTGSAYKNAMPDMGITPSNMPREAFSKNSVDIESALHGIGSTNLVNPQTPVRPELTKIPNVAFFDRMPCILPKPLDIAKNQRPHPI